MTCKDCAKWNEWKGHTPRIGFCQRTVDLWFTPMAWPDASCPAFESQKDWADAAAAEWYQCAVKQPETIQELAAVIRKHATVNYEGGKP